MKTWRALCGVHTRNKPVFVAKFIPMSTKSRGLVKRSDHLMLPPRLFTMSDAALCLEPPFAIRRRFAVGQKEAPRQ